MGVRFECPQGHKLHVKAHLAGQRGICPECGLRFIVPSFSGGRVPEAPAGEAASRSGYVSVSMESTATFNAALAASEAGDAAGGESTVWYVRPASGGQYGPVNTAGFQQWIAEGRVGADAWVWRTGWPEWRAGAIAVRSINAPRPRTATPTPGRAASLQNNSQTASNVARANGHRDTTSPDRAASPGHAAQMDPRPSNGASSNGASSNGSVAASVKPSRFSDFSPALSAALEPAASNAATVEPDLPLPEFALGEALDELFSKPRNGEPSALMPPVMAARATRDKRRPNNHLLTGVLAAVAAVLLVVLVVVLRRPKTPELLIEDVPATPTTSALAS